MEREEKHNLMKILLTAKANDDKDVIRDSFNEIIKKEVMDWYEI